MFLFSGFQAAIHVVKEDQNCLYNFPIKSFWELTHLSR